MSSERRDRFLKLERARPDATPVPPPVVDRFRPPPDRTAQVEEDRRAQAAAREAEQERARQAEAAEAARRRRELGETLARRERDRVDAQFPDGPFGTGRTGPSGTVGMRLLRMLPGFGWRIAAALAVFGIPLLLLLFTRGMPQLVGMAFLFAVVSLFSPRGGRRRRW